MGTPDYVLVKNATIFLLLRNNPDKNWLVFNWTGEFESGDDEIEYDLNGRGRDSGQTSISHFALVSGGSPPPTPHNTIPVQAPEPATLGLMGIGLVAAGLRRRRKDS